MDINAIQGIEHNYRPENSYITNMPSRQGLQVDTNYGIYTTFQSGNSEMIKLQFVGESYSRNCNITQGNHNMYDEYIPNITTNQQT